MESSGFGDRPDARLSRDLEPRDAKCRTPEDRSAALAKRERDPECRLGRPDVAAFANGTKTH